MLLEFFSIDDSPRSLSGETVHLWSAGLERCFPDSLLTENEFARALRFKMERTRRQFIAARAQLRIILGRYLDLEPRAVPITVESSGKPILDPAFGSDLQFNVSHSESLAVYAVASRFRVGVDVEQKRVIPHAEGLVERFFTPRERDLYFALPQSERLTAFYCAWTRKEAALKAVGRGVQAIDQCDVTFLAGEPGAVLRLGEDNDVSGKWFLRSWQPRPDYAAAVAVEVG